MAGEDGRSTTIEPDETAVVTCEVALWSLGLVAAVVLIVFLVYAGGIIGRILDD